MNVQQLVAATVAALAFACTANAQDTLKLASGQRGNWDTSVSEVGQRAGIFKKHGLVLEILWTQGSGETQQPVISGDVDIGVAVGVMGALSSYSKGAPVRIIGALDTPVPYSPPLEDFFLPSEADIESAARLLVAY